MAKRHGLTYESVEDLAEDLNLGRSVTYKCLREGTIPSIRLGKKFIIPRSAIAEWLLKQAKVNGNGGSEHA
jgi:excisionase family DNA binding protein